MEQLINATDKDNMDLQGQKQEKIKFNLQLFGEGGDGGATEPPAEPPAEPKTYTEEEYNKALQSESDKRVTEALKTAKEKWLEEYEQKLENEKSEAARLAKLSAEERAKAEFEKEKEKFNKDKEEFEKKSLEMEVVKQLSKEGLDTEFATFLVGKDADTSKQNIETFKTAFDKAVEVAVNEKLKGKAPAVGNDDLGASKTDIGNYASGKRLIK